MGAEQNNRTLSGKVEIDGTFFGGYRKPENVKRDRVDPRLGIYRKKQAVVVMRERKGRTLAFVYQHEGKALGTIRNRVATGSTVFADEAACWDGLHARFDMRRINHSVQFSDEGVCTNQAESYFSRLRRMEIGTHHHVSGEYLHQYAREATWREDHRREPNGTQYS